MNVDQEKPKNKKFALAIPQSKLEQFEQKVEEKITKLNQKNKGRSVTNFDLFDYFLDAMTEKDVEKIQERTLTRWDRMEIMKDEHNKKYGLNLTLEEYLAEKLKLN